MRLYFFYMIIQEIMDIKVGIIITTHKRHEDVVYRAIKSVLEQTYDNFSLIIVDDSPPDYERRSFVATMVNNILDERIIYYQNETNMGACASRNKGVEMCEGEFIAFLDDDDEWYPTKLERELKGFTDEDVGIVYCNADLYYEATGKIKLKNIKDDLPRGFILNKLFFRNVIGSTSFPIIRRTEFEKVGGFDYTMPALQDWDLWIRIAYNSKVNYIHEALCRYHFYEGDRLSNNAEKRLNGYIKIREKNRDYLECNSKAKTDFDLAAVFFYSNNRKLGKAIEYWLKAVVGNPLNIKMNIVSIVKAVGRSMIRAKIR